MLPSLFSAEADPADAAILALADGTVFRGVSIGASGHCVAEIVFNTLMSGQQEIVTDPAYNGQIVAFTYPHIGNTGVNTEDSESSSAQISGLVVRDCPHYMSNFRASQSLPDYLRQNGIVAISGIDTRKLTRILRDGGKQSACIFVGTDADQALQLARQGAGMRDQQRLANVTATSATSTSWSQGSWELGSGYQSRPDGRWHVVVCDFGAKFGALRMLADRDCRVTVVPGTSTAEQILVNKPDGLFLAGGPGDPAAYEAAIELCRQLLDAGIPMFGTGMGMQLIALALGASTAEMPTGHHGGNHPVRQLDSGRVFITSQKHDFTVKAETLPGNASVTHLSLFDSSVQGFRLTDAPVFGVQAYPEASPGPRDLAHTFDTFISLMAAQN